MNAKYILAALLFTAVTFFAVKAMMWEDRIANPDDCRRIQGGQCECRLHVDKQFVKVCPCPCELKERLKVSRETDNDKAD